MGSERYRYVPMKGRGSWGLTLKTVYSAGTTPFRISSMATTGLRARCQTTRAAAAACPSVHPQTSVSGTHNERDTSERLGFQGLSQDICPSDWPLCEE